MPINTTPGAAAELAAEVAAEVAALPATKHVLVIASEQLTPSLQFLLHVAKQAHAQPLAVHIYCTPDERRSLGPANRLKQSLQRWFDRRQRQVDIQLVVGGMWPQDVRAQVKQVLEQDPDAEWIINVTGGTKPMSAALTEIALCADLPDCRVIYSEIDGQWVELGADDSGLLISTPLQAENEPIIPPASTLDDLMPVADLVATQFSSEHTITTQRLGPMPALDAWVEALVAHQWAWQASLREVSPQSPCSGNGDAFERFLGAGLKACGLNPVHSLKVNSAQSTQVVREVDLVGCVQGRLYCIDIKLPGANELAKGTQLADVAELAQSLGGRAAHAIAVRPGWSPSADIAALAKALGVRLLTQQNAPQIFSTLLAWLAPQRALPPELARAEQLLQSQARLGCTVLSTGDLATKAQPNASGLLVVTNALRSMAQQSGKVWALANLGDPVGYQLVVYRNSAGLPPSLNWDALLQQLFSALANVVQTTVAPALQVSAHQVVWCFRLQHGRKQAEVLAVLNAHLPWLAVPA